MSNHLRLFVPLFGFFAFSSICHGELKIVPTLNSKLTATNSVAYCPTLQIAWDGLKRIVGGPIEMAEQDALVGQLNAASCPTSVVPEACHVAMVGYADQGIVPKLKEALSKKFGSTAPEVPAILTDKRTVIVTYSYLCRSLPFPKKFARSTILPLDFRSGTNTHPVQFFGAPQPTADDFASQVEIIHYSGENDFVIRLASRIENEFIVLAKIKQPDTFASGTETIRMYLEAERKGFTELKVNGKNLFYMNTLAKWDLLAIPVIDFNIETNFPELCERNFKNKGFDQIWLHQVYQNIYFKMDETGATVRSTAYGGALGGSSQPRRFVFDRPFLLTLWKMGAKQPYLAVWVASTDVMLPFVKNW